MVFQTLEKNHKEPISGLLSSVRSFIPRRSFYINFSRNAKLKLQENLCFTCSQCLHRSLRPLLGCSDLGLSRLAKYRCINSCQTVNFTTVKGTVAASPSALPRTWPVPPPRLLPSPLRPGARGQRINRDLIILIMVESCEILVYYPVSNGKFHNRHKHCCSLTFSAASDLACASAAALASAFAFASAAWSKRSKNQS